MMKSLDSSSFTHLVLESTTPQSDLLRYCLSDRLTLGVDAVVHSDNVTPITFTKHALRQHGSIIQKQFFPQFNDTKRISKEMRDSVIYDQLMITALTYRLIYAHPATLTRVSHFTIMATAELLRLHHDVPRDVPYIGLGHYATMIKAFMIDNKPYHGAYKASINSLIDSVGDINDETWILDHPHWNKALRHHPRRIKAFRNFLHMGLSSYLSHPQKFQYVHDIDVKQVHHYIEDFIALRLDPDVSFDDVNLFVRSLFTYFDTVQPNHGLDYIFYMPYTEFKEHHLHTYGQDPPPVTTESSASTINVTFNMDTKSSTSTKE